MNTYKKPEEAKKKNLIPVFFKEKIF